jgi:hypothetical protein
VTECEYHRNRWIPLNEQEQIRLLLPPLPPAHTPSPHPKERTADEEQGTSSLDTWQVIDGSGGASLVVRKSRRCQFPMSYGTCGQKSQTGPETNRHLLRHLSSHQSRSEGCKKGSGVLCRKASFPGGAWERTIRKALPCGENSMCLGTRGRASKTRCSQAEPGNEGFLQSLHAARGTQNP